MADDELLREALLELQLLRDREARSLAETQTLLECLEAYTTAPNPGAALASIFMSLRQKIGADLSLVLRSEADGRLIVLASDAAELVETELDAPIDLFARPRNITDMSLVGVWAGALDFSSYGGLLVVPVLDNIAFLSLRRKPALFGKDSLSLVLRLAGLAFQAVQNSKIASENTLLAAAIAGSSSGFAISDATNEDRPLVYVNAAFEAISGYSAAEVLGQNCRFLTAEPEDSSERARLRDAVSRKVGGTFLLRNRRKSGELFWNELTLFPVSDGDGLVRSLVATQVDVSDRVEAARERDRAKARMDQALAATEDAFLVLEEDGHVAFTNGTVNTLFPSPELAWAAGTAFEANWAAYLDNAKDFPGRTTKLLKDADLKRLSELHGAQDVDLPDGRNILLRAAALDDGGLVISATDVTAMKSAQRLLAQRLAAIEAAIDGIAVTDDAGRLVYLNSAAATLLGFSSAASGLGRKWHRQYSGPVSIPAQKPFERTLTLDGHAGPATHDITGSPLENGGSVIVVRDVTATLATEAREAELMRDLIRLQRQEAIAQLTAGIAHDFNNLLSAINGSATLIEMSSNIPDPIRPHLDRIMAAGAQSAKLVNQLLDIGAGSDADGAFDLRSVLRDLPVLVQPSLPEGMTFEVDPGAATLALRGSPGALSQVLINLCLNARDAMEGGVGQISLTASECRGGTLEDLRIGQAEETARYARIEVADTGIGMDEDTAAGIFQPYFTTKGRQGTGLGMAIVSMQVQSVGGSIGLRTAPGHGTAISIYWPLAGGAPSESGPVLSTGHDLSDMTVIVVDDDPGVGQVIADYLQAHGAEVAVCEDPRDAAMAITEDPESWSALITDYDMPAMNGGELAAFVREIVPDLPIFVVTALARRLTDPRLVNGQVAGILSKPVDLDQLCRAVAERRPDEKGT
ncbi:PAS domain S-box protein [Gymnodinialimonas sp. 2305UL16-5]|uniref:PAS domain S-box protein n=1 Tax=Gymnodinialimonas mytili TaxID=3126503 RepID=UPI0030ABBC5B